MINIYQKGLIYYRIAFFCFCLSAALFLLGCAGKKILVDGVQNKTALINKINYNCQKIKDLSGCINLDVKIGNKRLIQKGYFFCKTPNLLKINFIGWFGVPRAVFLMNQGIKIYFYRKGVVFDLEEGKIPFLNFKQKISLDGFDIFGEDGKNYIFYKENKKIWVDKKKLVIIKIELFDDKGKILSKIDFKTFKKINKILVPHKIGIQVFSCQQLGQEFTWFAETIGTHDIRKIDILLYLKKLSINKG
ncbi:hypothetical protein KAU39_07510, partial [bacterium]|nr:hypothetical protein [bacterium]